MKKVAVVVLNHNRKEDTIECLASISQLSIINYQLSIIVVDNASDDGSVQYIKNQKSLRRQSYGASATKIKSLDQDLEIIENKQNLGFCGGNNVGIRLALKNAADYIMVLNNDTVVDQGLVVQLIKVAEKRSDIGILSPKIYFEKGFEFHKKRYKKEELGKVIWYAGGTLDWNNVYGANRGVDEVDRGQYDQAIETDFATGACLFARREALEKTGLFDEKYFMYLEDADLSQRMKKDGWKVFYVPGACLWHKVGRSAGIGSELADYFLTRNRLLFGSRYAPLKAKLALIRESVRLVFGGRTWQRAGVRDFYRGRFGKGSWTAKIKNQKLKIKNISQKVTISVVIIAKDEEKMLPDCLKSIGMPGMPGEWASEIILVDNGSKDKTVELAKNWGAKIVRNETPDFSESRNKGRAASSCEWILYVDADERVTEELREEIELLIASHESPVTGYAIPRRNFILGQELRFGGWWPDYVKRLFRKNKLKGWQGQLHEEPVFEGEMGHLKNSLVHIKHENFSEMVEKTDRWSDIEAKLMFEANHPKMNVLRFLSGMAREFWHRMIVKAAFLDGTTGIMFALYQVFSRFISYAKLWELQLERLKPKKF